VKVSDTILLLMVSTYIKISMYSTT